MNPSNKMIFLRGDQIWSSIPTHTQPVCVGVFGCSPALNEEWSLQLKVTEFPFKKKKESTVRGQKFGPIPQHPRVLC